VEERSYGQEFSDSAFNFNLKGDFDVYRHVLRGVVHLWSSRSSAPKDRKESADFACGPKWSGCPHQADVWHLTGFPGNSNSSKERSMFHAVLLTIIWVGFGMWGIRKLLGQNPTVSKAASRGVASLISRLFGL
jgi:hypothetical protein